MLEIMVVIFLSRHLRGVCAAKGRSAWWAALGPLGWFAGEFGGGLVSALAGADELGLLGAAIACAVVGGVTGAVLVHLLPGIAPADVDPGDLASSARDNVYASGD